jgi:hypothetical protein
MLSFLWESGTCLHFKISSRIVRSGNKDFHWTSLWHTGLHQHYECAETQRCCHQGECL